MQLAASFIDPVVEFEAVDCPVRESLDLISVLGKILDGILPPPKIVWDKKAQMVSIQSANIPLTDALRFPQRINSV
jgi:hypothetical protein